MLYQDEAGRLWDVLYQLRMAIGRGGRVMPFALQVRSDNRERTPACAPEFAINLVRAAEKTYPSPPRSIQ
jgi:hypothetical protein